MADKTLSQIVSEARTAQQSIVDGNPTRPLLSKLNIGGQLYSIKDPVVEQLATAVDSRLEAIESKSWTLVTKGQDAGQFATSVTQDATGAITVTYGNATATDVSFSETNWNAANVKAAIIEALSKAIGTSNDAASADTINGAKAYTDDAITALEADIDEANEVTTDALNELNDRVTAARTYAEELVNNLAGVDWEQNAKKVQEIIAEIENSDNANAWSTAIDKLAGLGIKTPAVYYTQAECDEYNTENSLQDGDEGYRTTSDVKTPAVYNTVKDYVDNAVASADVSGQITSAINNLDATVGSTTVATGKHVAVQVVEADGILTGITVTEDDIASAQDLQDLKDTIDEQNEVTAASLNDLNVRIISLNADKANKAAITTGTINNWSSSYDSVNETLQWTNTSTSVYVPVSGETL